VNQSFDEYQRAILLGWSCLSCTRGRPPRSDRAMLFDLYHREIPLSLVLVALRLATARRSPDLPPVRSLAYFRAVIDELADADPQFVTYLDAHLSP
jgi:hypothetical protein